jgi:hypothetical protein
MNRLYIASIDIQCEPKHKQSRYKPVRIRKDFQPIILDEDTLRIPTDEYMKTIEQHLRYKKNNEWKTYIKDFSKYNIRYTLSNIKFSSNLYGQKT